MPPPPHHLFPIEPKAVHIATVRRGGDALLQQAEQVLLGSERCGRSGTPRLKAGEGGSFSCVEQDGARAQSLAQKPLSGILARQACRNMPSRSATHWLSRRPATQQPAPRRPISQHSQHPLTATNTG